MTESQMRCKLLKDDLTPEEIEDLLSEQAEALYDEECDRRAVEMDGK